ncbi:MAG: rhodanese-like domain-containing protein [Chitinophagaceae bacterium]
MKKLGLAATLLMVMNFLLAQYVNDNKLFRTVSWQQLCKEIQAKESYMLLDVRSPGEFSDTSESENYNMGHLKGAINIPLNQLGERLGELEPYHGKTIYVYCSHSQRSRRGAKLLSEKGFKNVVNVNGGMTQLNLEKNNKVLCGKNIYETKNAYQLLSPTDVCRIMAEDKTVLVLDIRNDSVYRGISTNEKLNANGRFKKTLHIPADRISANMGDIAKDRQIIVVDDFGDASPAVAKSLLSNGYRNVGILFNGMQMWTDMPLKRLPCKDELVSTRVPYGLLSVEDLGGWMKTNKDALVIDTRNTEEFRNSSKDSWRNIGNIVRAKNFPAAAIQGKMEELLPFKDKPILLYGLGSSPEVFGVAKMLTDSGFTQIQVLLNGLFTIRWTAANLEGYSDLKALVTNVPEENW